MTVMHSQLAVGNPNSLQITEQVLKILPLGVGEAKPLDVPVVLYVMHIHL